MGYPTPSSPDAILGVENCPRNRRKEFFSLASGVIVAHLSADGVWETQSEAKGNGGEQPREPATDQDDAWRCEGLLGLFKCYLHPYLEVVCQRAQGGLS